MIPRRKWVLWPLEQSSPVPRPSVLCDSRWPAVTSARLASSAILAAPPIRVRGASATSVPALVCEAWELLVEIDPGVRDLVRRGIVRAEPLTDDEARAHLAEVGRMRPPATSEKLAAKRRALQRGPADGGRVQGQAPQASPPQRKPGLDPVLAGQIADHLGGYPVRPGRARGERQRFATAAPGPRNGLLGGCRWLCVRQGLERAADPIGEALDAERLDDVVHH